MKVLLLNGSPNDKGCTFTALKEVSTALEVCGIETEIIGIGKNKIRGCIACGACDGNGCVFKDDITNEIYEKMDSCDGFIVGAPVYYASPNGTVLSLLDRLFYSGGKRFHNKPGAAIVSARRAGTTASLDVLNKYFIINRMPIVPSQYWPMVHGLTAEDVQKDAEGLQIMRTLGRNMAWLLACIEAGKKDGILPPVPEEKRETTNFIK